MRVLVIGSGGREHALAAKLAASRRVEKVYCAPGNGGIGEIAEIAEIQPNDFKKIAAFIEKESIGLVAVGPEVPLAAGIVDYLKAGGYGKVFGPEAKCAKLESSKVFSKRFMKKHGIPTADFEVFHSYEEAADYVKKSGENFSAVVKADGIAAGKGVFVCDSAREANDALHRILRQKEFGNAGDCVLIEDKLKGEEASMMAFCDGSTLVPMIASQDHKRIFDDDKGPNTGGMGAYAPAPVVTGEIFEKVRKSVFNNFIKGIKSEGMNFKGVIYAGIMIDGADVWVLEFNVRFGDPETQVVLPLLETDLVDVMEAVIEGRLDENEVKWRDKSSVCVVMASGGYPGKYEKGDRIWGLEAAGAVSGVEVFHAGTKKSGDGIVTDGGRVLGVTACEGSIKEAISKAYSAVSRISFRNMYFRKDIGHKASVAPHY